ncbi:hypothetical protein BDA99DRAFT_546870 [Phascolomyces articulosus]|uniref:DUF155 domain-containing protein n=1 Tax=Phascolomyces articulosus TaxID=60185 RepID=A0AAD5KEB5_9FUNG|nr:hypothetical protein BDA99DRAFT_546870 [Phascolomyces articulosus]
MKKTADSNKQPKPSAISREVLKPSTHPSPPQAESSSSNSRKNVAQLRRTESDFATVPPRPKPATQPLRSSKISQKLVVFPSKSVEASSGEMDNVLPSPSKPEFNQQQREQNEEQQRLNKERQKQREDQVAWNQEEEAWNATNEERETAEILGSTYGYRTEAEFMTQDEREFANLSRVAAYCTGEGYSIGPLRQFLRQHHRVTPRLYDECLYAAYHFPLLTMRPGKDNLLNVRVRSAYTRIGSISDDSEMDYDEDTYERNGIDTIGSHLHVPDADEDGQEEDDDRRSITIHRYSMNDNNEVLRSSISAPASPVKEDMPTSPLTAKTLSTAGLTTGGDASASATAPDAPTTTMPRRNSIFTGGEVFLFDYGVVVFWNFNRAQELLMLEDFAQFSIRPFRDNPDEDMQIEEMHFQYDVSQVKPRIFNDMITLKKMAQTGRLVKNRVEITKINGNLFNLRMNVNLVSNVLDTPEIFWSEPALQPMYNAIKDYLEIPQRVKILNDRLKVISDLLSMLRDHLTNFGVEYQTLIIIYLIIIAVIVACFEIAVKVLQTVRVL